MSKNRSKRTGSLKKSNNIDKKRLTDGTDQSGRERKEDLVIFSVFIVIIAGIVGGYFLYDTISPDDGGRADDNTHGINNYDPLVQGSNEETNDPPGESNNDQSTAPTFTLLDINGNTVSLSDHRGKVVVLDLMATWCPPCKTEMGHLKEIFKKYSSSQVTIMSIGVDPKESNEELRAFRDTYGDDWIFARDIDDVGEKYEVTNIPEMVIVDKNGNIAYESVGLTEAHVLSAEIDKLL